MSISYIIFSCVLSANHLIKNVFHIVNLSRGHYINDAFGSLQAGWEWNAFDRLEDRHLTNNNAEAGNKRLGWGASKPEFLYIIGVGNPE